MAQNVGDFVTYRLHQWVYGASRGPGARAARSPRILPRPRAHEREVFDGVPELGGGALHPDRGRPGHDLSLRRDKAETYAS
jgi:hypothetical protein